MKKVILLLREQKRKGAKVNPGKKKLFSATFDFSCTKEQKVKEAKVNPGEKKSATFDFCSTITFSPAFHFM